MSGSDLKLSKQQEDVALALKIKNDLNDYFKFVSLTEKKRSPRHTRLIEEYIKRESNITQRIHFIEELDREEQFAHKMGPAIDSDDIKKLKQKEQAKKKKKKISRSSFLTYLFSGRKDIKNFGARTNILKSGLFSIRITGDSEHYYKTLLSRVTTLLLKATNFMVENSWKSLNRTSYNVIITFSRFLKRFIQEGNIFALQDPISIFSKMEKYIIPYLQVASKRVNKDLLKEAFYETLYFEAAFKADFREIIHVVNELLDIDSRGMRFFNVILGTFMIQFRHFVSLPHMLNHYNVPEIDDSHYDFSPKIKGQIQEEIESGSYKFREMEEGLYYLRFIDESFNFSAPLENPVVQVFGRVFFYTRTKPPMTFEKLVTSGDFHDEAFLGSFKANITPVLYNYLIGFLTIFGPFLRGQVSVKGKDNLTHEVSLFSNW
ncbi:MAG: hypothetical protein OEZ36_14090, partial [Spirochaetota bacterium]|nr:hypothetical protein [Spirochaetota bacterium]